MPKFVVEIEIDMEDGASVADARTWGAAILDTAFTKPNPVPRPEPGEVAYSMWRPFVPRPASEHPYRPRVGGARRIP